MIEIHKNRAIITLAGPERKNLLQSIITANINHLGNDRGLYAALLTPQGKFLHDFFLYEDNEIIYLDCERNRIADLFRRLLMYRLRSKVEIIDCSRNFSVITSSKKINGYDLNFTDPRHSEMGCRAIVEIDTKGAKEDTYHTRRIALGIPEGSHDFIVEKSTILEGHFEQIKSNIADIVSTAGRPGASIGAAVIGTFVDENLPWVHLDIAGVDWRDSPTPTTPKGHAGWGVRFMNELIREEANKLE